MAVDRVRARAPGLDAVLFEVVVIMRLDGVISWHIITFLRSFVSVDILHLHYPADASLRRHYSALYSFFSLLEPKRTCTSSRVPKSTRAKLLRPEMMCDHDIRACSSLLRPHAKSFRKTLRCHWCAWTRQGMDRCWSCNPSI